jgi:nucleotide-binding universal stress UspA family protein
LNYRVYFPYGSEMMKLNKVLVPIDNSQFSLEVLSHLTQLMDPAKTELILLHVEPTPESVVVDEHVVAYSDQVAASIEADSKATIQPYVKSLQEIGYHVTPIISFGDPAKEIEYYVEKENVDLVAITTHGRRGLANLLHGSVAQHVCNHVDVPVLLYRGEVDDGGEGALGL